MQQNTVQCSVNGIPIQYNRHCILHQCNIVHTRYGLYGLIKYMLTVVNLVRVRLT